MSWEESYKRVLEEGKQKLEEAPVNEYALLYGRIDAFADEVFPDIDKFFKALDKDEQAKKHGVVDELKKARSNFEAAMEEMETLLANMEASIKDGD